VNPELLTIILKDLAIPLVMTAVRAHQNATGKMPTDAEVLAALQVDADQLIKKGEAWIAARAETRER
jgi:ABC-type transport system involved in cytochrome c biogenesis permease component